MAERPIATDDGSGRGEEQDRLVRMVVSQVIAEIRPLIERRRLSSEEIDAIADRVAEYSARRIVQRLRTEPAAAPAERKPFDAEAAALRLLTPTPKATPKAPRRKP